VTARGRTTRAGIGGDTMQQWKRSGDNGVMEGLNHAVHRSWMTFRQCDRDFRESEALPASAPSQ
jgi:hypothetical protein